MSKKPALSLRVSHPKMAPPTITNALGMSAPKYSWEVGKARKTPKGTPLTVKYSDTYCCFVLPISPEGVQATVTSLLDRDLGARKRSVHRIVSTGGRVELYLTWQSRSNAGQTFNWKTLQKLAAFHIDLSVEWFPD
jgi:hypothetical protein